MPATKIPFADAMPDAPWRLLIALVLLLAGTPASAATLEVDVQDRNGKALAQAVVYLESADAKRLAKPALGLEMAQEKRQFNPRVMALPVGTELAFPNRDSVRHHVYSFSPAKPFEIRLYSGVPAAPVLFDKPGVVVLGCNIHDAMVAWIVVVETPYYALTDVAGKASLPNVPAGAYLLRVWHAGLALDAAPHAQPLTLPATGAAQTVRLELEAK